MDLSSAIQDFHRARRRAAMQELTSWLKGETADLLSYEEVRRQLKATAGAERGLHDIPLDAIVGSVGRYADFTRGFLPKDEVNVQRWARVKVATLGMTGLPAIDVYRIGDVYFVSDGSHRVSVARELGATHIQAYVTEADLYLWVAERRAASSTHCASSPRFWTSVVTSWRSVPRPPSSTSATL